MAKMDTQTNSLLNFTQQFAVKFPAPYNLVLLHEVHKVTKSGVVITVRMSTKNMCVVIPMMPKEIGLDSENPYPRTPDCYLKTNICGHTIWTNRRICQYLIQGLKQVKGNIYPASKRHHNFIKQDFYQFYACQNHFTVYIYL